MKNIIIGFIKFYKVLLSPILPSSCKFYPTCSDYMILSIEKYGVLKGLLKGIWRIIRCNPISKGGIDYP
ncbi:MAG: membrane protein insertion efficiency factor YidD [Candidatus Hydrothermia bacterium]|jgi:putative membrane protein insertion efficiency factor|nr:membrane protein insertion efficiency factor YidD [Candidatus Hydrothermia bacterium]